MSDVYKKLAVLMADTYALYLKTQNYHWHVRGAQFKGLHQLFDEQYHELADAADAIAERIVTLGQKAPATFKEFEELKRVKEGDSSLNANEMLADLAHDNDTLVKDLNQAMALVHENNDEGTANLLANRIEAHEKSPMDVKRIKRISHSNGSLGVAQRILSFRGLSTESRKPALCHI